MAPDKIPIIRQALSLIVEGRAQKQQENVTDGADVPAFPPGAVHATVRAGDCVLMTEATTHGVLPWVGGGQRRVLALRYTPHGMHGTSSRNGLSPEVQARLALETLELCAYLPPGATKTIARRGVVVLPAGPGPGDGREARL